MTLRIKKQKNITQITIIFKKNSKITGKKNEAETEV
jgi:hypothetical protein